MTYTLNHEAITFPHYGENRNIILGTLESGDPVKVSREMDGFRVFLIITVGGIVFHSCEAGKEEKDFFYALDKRIHEEKDAEYNATREAVRKSAAAIFGK